MEDLDTAAPIWRLPGARVKSTRSRQVPLSLSAAAIVRERITFLERHGDKANFIFPSRVSSWEPATAAFLPQAVSTLREKTKRVPWTAHDLRRTAATLASEGGSREEDIGALLGHREKTVTGRVYNLNKRLPEMRQAVDAIERAVLKACKA